MLNIENIIADLAVRAEIDVRIFSGGRDHCLELDLLKSTLAGSSLLGL